MQVKPTKPLGARMTKNRKELHELFEEKYLKGTCFNSLEELRKDNSTFENNLPRALTALELHGIWRGLQELLKG